MPLPVRSFAGEGHSRWYHLYLVYAGAASASIAATISRTMRGVNIRSVSISVLLATGDWSRAATGMKAIPALMRKSSEAHPALRCVYRPPLIARTAAIGNRSTA